MGGRIDPGDYAFPVGKPPQVPASGGRWSCVHEHLLAEMSKEKQTVRTQWLARRPDRLAASTGQDLRKARKIGIIQVQGHPGIWFEPHYWG